MALDVLQGSPQYPLGVCHPQKACQTEALGCAVLLLPSGLGRGGMSDHTAPLQLPAWLGLC